MSVIKAYMQAQSGERHMVELPQSEDELQQNLTEFGIVGQSCEGISSDIPAVSEYLRETEDVYELNNLAEWLDGLDASEQEQYGCVLNECHYLDIHRMTVIAERFTGFDIVPDIRDTTDLGDWYVNEEYPRLDDIIRDNLDFDGIGSDVLQYVGGKLTDAGYIRNFDEVMASVSDAIDIRQAQEASATDRTYEAVNGTVPSGVKHVNVDEVRSMTDREGLILQGCGGDLREWVDGINETLTDEGTITILKYGRRRIS